MQEKVSTIVMLSTARTKKISRRETVLLYYTDSTTVNTCSKYFPAKEGEVMVHGEITIKNVSTKSSKDHVFETRKLELTDPSGIFA